MRAITNVNLIEQMRTMMAEAAGNKIDPKGGSVFNQVFEQALEQANGLAVNSRDLINRYQLGDPNVSLSEAMVASQKAQIGLQATLSIRNKLVAAYQDIMNMPV